MSRQLSKKTLDKSFWNWFFWNGCSQQAESMLGLAFGQAMAPVVDELYDSKEEKAEALKRHVTLFNTEAQVGSICNGIVCGMEEANANGQCTPDVINTVKVALIGLCNSSRCCGRCRCCYWFLSFFLRWIYQLDDFHQNTQGCQYAKNYGHIDDRNQPRISSYRTHYFTSFFLIN